MNIPDPTNSEDTVQDQSTGVVNFDFAKQRWRLRSFAAMITLVHTCDAANPLDSTT